MYGQVKKAVGRLPVHLSSLECWLITLVFFTCPLIACASFNCGDDHLSNGLFPSCRLLPRHLVVHEQGLSPVCQVLQAIWLLFSMYKLTTWCCLPVKVYDMCLLCIRFLPHCHVLWQVHHITSHGFQRTGCHLSACCASWSTMECSHQAAWTTNRSNLLVSYAKAFPGRPTNSSLTLPRAAHLEGGVIDCHQCIPSYQGSAPASPDMRPPLLALSHMRPTPPGFVPHTTYPPGFVPRVTNPPGFVPHATNPSWLCPTCNQPSWLCPDMRPTLLALSHVRPTHPGFVPRVTNPPGFVPHATNPSWLCPTCDQPS